MKYQLKLLLTSSWFSRHLACSLYLGMWYTSPTLHYAITEWHSINILWINSISTLFYLQANRKIHKKCLVYTQMVRLTTLQRDSSKTHCTLQDGQGEYSTRQSNTPCSVLYSPLSQCAMGLKGTNSHQLDKILNIS